MANNDKTISQLCVLNLENDFRQHENDLYLVSHPTLKDEHDEPKDYVTHKVELTTLADLVVSAAYETISSRVESDLHLGALARKDMIDDNSLVGAGVVRLDTNVNSNTYGMLAKTPELMTCISDSNNIIRNNLGFKELAFRDESYLSLGALAHKSRITSVDVEFGAKFPSSQIAVDFKNLCLSDESMLSLSALAHQDVVRPYQVVAGLSLEQLVLSGPHGWQTSCDARYLSAPTSSSRGSIAVGYTSNDTTKNYALTVDNSNVKNGYVHVPWRYSDHYTSCSLYRNDGKNSLTFVQKISAYTESTGNEILNKTVEIDIAPIITNNLVGTGDAGKVAIFSGRNNLSGGASLTAGITTQYYQANGKFGEIPKANKTTYGLVKADGVADCLAVFSGSNTFQYGAKLTANVTTQYYQANGKFGEIPKANKTTYGLMKSDGEASHLAVFSGSNEISSGVALSANVQDKYYRADGKFENIPNATGSTYGLVKANGSADKVAIFSGTNTFTGGATLTAGITDKYYRADGTFDKIPTATTSNLGLVQLGYSYNQMVGNNIPVLADNGKLYSNVPTAANGKLGMVKVGSTKTDTNIPVQLDNNSAAYVNVPQATATALGTVKIGFTRSDTKLPVQLDSGKAYVDSPYASSSLPGTIKIGAARTSVNLPVLLDNAGRAYVTLSDSGSSGGSGGSVVDEMAANIMKSIYPIGAIYLTIAATCPMEGIGGMRWTKVEGRYLLASGQLATNESYAAGSEVAAGLPSHTHTVSFNFSSHSSTDGYPHHGSGSACDHSSYRFTTSGASNSIYGSSGTVRPKAYAVNVFRRDA